MPSYTEEFLFFREPIKLTKSASVTGITIIEWKLLGSELVSYKIAESIWIFVRLSLSINDKK